MCSLSASYFYRLNARKKLQRERARISALVPPLFNTDTSDGFSHLLASLVSSVSLVTEDDHVPVAEHS